MGPTGVQIETLRSMRGNSTVAAEIAMGSGAVAGVLRAEAAGLVDALSARRAGVVEQLSSLVWGFPEKVDNKPTGRSVALPFGDGTANRPQMVVAHANSATGRHGLTYYVERLPGDPVLAASHGGQRVECLTTVDGSQVQAIAVACEDVPKIESIKQQGPDGIVERASTDDIMEAAAHPSLVLDQIELGLANIQIPELPVPVSPAVGHMAVAATQ